MTTKNQSLFTLVVEESRLNPTYQSLRTDEGHAPARWMLDQVYSNFVSPDTNFLEQFQTTGFNARYFELYLYAYLTRSGFEVERDHENPDFIVSRNGNRVAIEATTVNPSTSGSLAKDGHNITDLSPEQIATYVNEELPIRFGSPLLSKLNKEYWKLKHCKGLPFVIAIEAFHDERSLNFSDSALGQYLYGAAHYAKRTKSGRLSINSKRILKHSLGNKTIPSGFFDQPETEHISAVIFTNSGTDAKFSRMGYQSGIGNDRLMMIRVGHSFDQNPDAKDPALFWHNLDSPLVVESWGQGLVVFHNSKALYPISREYFSDAMQHYMNNGQFTSEIKGWHPTSSNTGIFDLGDQKSRLAGLPFLTFSHTIETITKKEFQNVTGFDHDINQFLTEDGWYSDDCYAFLGVICQCKTDHDWTYIIMARDQRGQFRAIFNKSDITSRELACRQLQEEISGLLSKPKRIFEQD